MEKVTSQPKKKCTVAGCTNPQQCYWGLCRAHYQHLRKLARAARPTITVDDGYGPYKIYLDD